MMGGLRTAWAVTLMLCALSGTAQGKEQVVHEKAYHSGGFELGPGDVTEFFRVADFPEGHIGMRNLFAEVVDENDVPVPLTEVYLHHWNLARYFVKKGYKQLVSSVPRTLDVGAGHSQRIAFQEGADPLAATEQGTCNGNRETVGFGTGSETRHSDNTVPPPYGYVYGDADAIPEGYEEMWILNVHAINTIDAVDRRKCMECYCESYGTTHDSHGDLLPKDYIGGLLCCYNNAHCAVKEGVQRVKKTYSFKYTVTWVDWDESVVPLRSYWMDVTDSRTSLTEQPQCKLEYLVPKCGQGTAINRCVDRRHSIAAVAIGGDLILGKSHQHLGALGAVLYDKDGTVLCTSEPIYGRGTEAGDEAGYVVGMTTCHPEPGTVTIESMKELHLDAYYSNEVQHTGVMSTLSFTLRIPSLALRR